MIVNKYARSGAPLTHQDLRRDINPALLYLESEKDPVATTAALSAYNAASTPLGTLKFVLSAGKLYQLTLPTGLTVDGVRVLSATGTTNYWVRVDQGTYVGYFNTASLASSRRLLDVSLAFIGPILSGDKVWVASVLDSYTWNSTSTLTHDGVNIVNPTANGVNPGRFIRDNISNQSWTKQATWYINTSTGSDENTGLASGTALKSWTEFRNRIGNNVIAQNTNIYLTGYFDYINCDMCCINGATVNVIGITTTLQTGLSITAFAARNRTIYPATCNQLTCGTVASWTPYTANTDGGIFIRLTSGTGIGADAYVLADLGSNVAQLSSFILASAPAEKTPAPGDTFDILQCPKIDSYNISPRGGVWVFQSIYFRQYGSDRVNLTTQKMSNLHLSLARNRFWTCTFDGFYADSGTIYLYGCSLLTSSSFNYCGGTVYGGCVIGGVTGATLPDGNMYIQAPTIGLSAGIILKKAYPVCQGGYTFVNDIGVFDSSTYAMQAIGGAQIQVTWLWGNTAGTTAVKIAAGDRMTYTNKPQINAGLGGTRETVVGGTSKAWSAIPYVETANNAMIVVNA